MQGREISIVCDCKLDWFNFRQVSVEDCLTSSPTKDPKGMFTGAFTLYKRETSRTKGKYFEEKNRAFELNISRTFATIIQNTRPAN